MSQSEVEKIWRSFWKPIVTRAGRVNMAQIKRELADYHFIMGEVSKAYDSVTGGRLSKPNTHASAIISEHDEFMREFAREETEHLTADLNRLNALIDCKPTTLRKLAGQVKPAQLAAFFQVNSWVLAREMDECFVYESPAADKHLSWLPKNQEFYDYADLALRACDNFSVWRDCTRLRAVADLLEFAGVDVAAIETDGPQ